MEYTHQPWSSPREEGLRYKSPPSSLPPSLPLYPSLSLSFPPFLPLSLSLPRSNLILRVPGVCVCGFFKKKTCVPQTGAEHVGQVYENSGLSNVHWSNSKHVLLARSDSLVFFHWKKPGRALALGRRSSLGPRWGICGSPTRLVCCNCPTVVAPRHSAAAPHRHGHQTTSRRKTCRTRVH